MEIPGYEIIGELAVDQTARRYLARREADGTDVLITVVDAPEGDEGNALNHLASDVKIMAAHPHPGVLGVLEGHWVGESFAVVTQRPAAPTLDELLVRRAEEFPFVRIATILRDINASLVWARDRGVVHRALSQETVFVEAGSDRTMVSFGVRPIGLTAVPGEEEDNRAIAELAALMFTRGRKLVDGEATLAEMRPGLPASLVTQTEALLGRAAEEAAVPTDMRSYIASIAMAEALKAGEEHLEANRNLIEQQQREHQEQLQKQRAEHEEALAQEKAAHQKEREAHQRDRECYERDLEVLRVERERYEEERERLRRERLDYDKEMSAILAQKARHRTRQGMELVARGWRRRPMWTTRLTRNWRMTAPIIAVAALVLVAAVALTQRENAPRGARVVADSAAGVVTPAPALAAPATIASDSVAADTTPRDSAGVPSGFLSGVMARAESLWARRPFRTEPSGRTVAPAPRPARSLDTIFTAPTLPPRDTVARDTFPRRDTTVRRDSVIRRDTIVRRDTQPPDSVPRRDTLPARADSLSRH